MTKAVWLEREFWQSRTSGRDGYKCMVSVILGESLRVHWACQGVPGRSPWVWRVPWARWGSLVPGISLGGPGASWGAPGGPWASWEASGGTSRISDRSSGSLGVTQGTEQKRSEAVSETSRSQRGLPQCRRALLGNLPGTLKDHLMTPRDAQRRSHVRARTP